MRLRGEAKALDLAKLMHSHAWSGEPRCSVAGLRDVAIFGQEVLGGFIGDSCDVDKGCMPCKCYLLVMFSDISSLARLKLKIYVIYLIIYLD